jgi:carbon-monoxide dehydrogenase large subunit
MDGDRPTAGPHIGRPLPRFEDLRLVRGAGRFSDDLSLPDQAYAVFVRSPHAHARVLAVDTVAARERPGVVAVLTGADYLADGCTGIGQIPVPADAIDPRRKAFAAPECTVAVDEPQLPLATERVRHGGEIVAMVVAETAAAARDGAEAVNVAYEILPAVTEVMAALAAEIQVSSGAPGNLALDAAFGSRDAVEGAMSRADLVVEQIFRNQRIVTAQMEPRAALASHDPAVGLTTLFSGSQGVHRQRQALAGALKLEPEQVRVVSPDVGGAFGTRNNLAPEQVLVAWAAQRTGRPVKWLSDRAEAFLSDFQGRDVVITARMAFDRRGRILGYALDLVGNVGAHTVSYVPLNNGYRVASSVYAVPAMHVRTRGVLTNTVPTAPFRGAGRPESLLVIERLLDIAAARLGIDRVAIRRRNLIRKLPWRTATGLTYDSGDFAGNMRRVLEMADWRGFPARRREAKKRGRLRGIGLANYVETPVGAVHERVELRVRSDDAVEVVAGTQSSGQGHETTFAQVAADRLGVAPDAVRFIGGDTATVRSGGGSHSDRSMRFAGTLITEAGASVIAQARKIAAALLTVPEAEIAFDDGLFHTPASNRRLSLFDVARAVDGDAALPEPLRRPLAAEATFDGRIPAYPTGAAVCELEVDPETGAIDICRYTSLDDAGQPINPMILHGQVHGGIAQGLGQALMERAVFAPDTGQLLTGSFLDYALPRAQAFPGFDVALTEDPTAGNPLRIKGGGEAGITPALAAAMNALVDALKDFGVEHVDMPATAARVWEAMAAGRPRSAWLGLRRHRRPA